MSWRGSQQMRRLVNRKCGRTARVSSAGVFAACASAVLLAGCSRDPNVTYARLLERAASWSASVQFGGEMARARYVPQAYVHDLLSTAAKELGAIRRQIQDDTDVDSASRNEHADVCWRLAALVDEADRARTLPDDRALRDLDTRLRAAAQTARRAVPETRP
jgi:hypothetical protein